MSERPDRVLVVDDEEVGRYTVARLLAAAGFEIGEAATGGEALAAVRASPPDLVVLDINLPDLSGFEVCRRIKADPATASIAVLHLSASFVEAEDAVRGLEGGADGYLTHPVEPTMLIATVKALLRARRAEAEARAAVRARDEFLSIASHELRTPITTLRLQTQSLLRRSRREPLPEAVVAKAETIDRQVSRLTRLVDDMLDVSRLTSGRLRLDLEAVDLVEVAREVLARTAPELAQAGCPTTLAAPPRLVGRWDRARLDQILSNLLANAAKYGGGRPVEVAVGSAGEVAELRVRDRGIGISEADQRRIFERFERVASERHFGGFGLGLWIVRRTLDAMGGSIAVESAPGEGATFTVRLPLKRG